MTTRGEVEGQTGCTGKTPEVGVEPTTVLPRRRPLTTGPRTMRIAAGSRGFLYMHFIARWELVASRATARDSQNRHGRTGSSWRQLVSGWWPPTGTMASAANGNDRESNCHHFSTNGHGQRPGSSPGGAADDGRRWGIRMAGAARRSPTTEPRAELSSTRRALGCQSFLCAKGLYPDRAPCLRCLSLALVPSLEIHANPRGAFPMALLWAPLVATMAPL